MTVKLGFQQWKFQGQGEQNCPYIVGKKKQNTRMISFDHHFLKEKYNK